MKRCDSEERGPVVGDVDRRHQERRGGVMFCCFKRSSCWKATNVNAEPRICELQGVNRVGNTRSIAFLQELRPKESKATQKNTCSGTRPIPELQPLEKSPCSKREEKLRC